MTDPYAVLGIPADAEFETIRTAYRRLVRDNHPDVALNKEAATALMAQINEAWRLIGAPDKRAAYDAHAKLQQHEQETQAASTDRIRLERQQRARMEREKLQARSRRPRSTRTASSKERATARKNEKAAPEKKNSHPKISSKNKNPARDMRVLHKMTLANQLFHRDGRFEEAAAVCREVLRADGRNVPARELLSDILAQQGRMEIALMMLDQAVQIAPHDRMLRRKRDRLQMQELKMSVTHKAPRKPKLSLLGRLRSCFAGKR